MVNGAHMSSQRGGTLQTFVAGCAFEGFVVGSGIKNLDRDFIRY
jgi:hypothetical protein